MKANLINSSKTTSVASVKFYQNSEIKIFVIILNLKKIFRSFFYFKFIASKKRKSIKKILKSILISDSVFVMHKHLLIMLALLSLLHMTIMLEVT